MASRVRQGLPGGVVAWCVGDSGGVDKGLSCWCTVYGWCRGLTCTKGLQKHWNKKQWNNGRQSSMMEKVHLSRETNRTRVSIVNWDKTSTMRTGTLLLSAVWMLQCYWVVYVGTMNNQSGERILNHLVCTALVCFRLTGFYWPNRDDENLTNQIVILDGNLAKLLVNFVPHCTKSCTFIDYAP